MYLNLTNRPLRYFHTSPKIIKNSVFILVFQPVLPPLTTGRVAENGIGFRFIATPPETGNYIISQTSQDRKVS